MSRYRKKKPFVPYCYRPYESVNAPGDGGIYHPWVIDTCLDGYPNPLKVEYSINLRDCDDEIALKAYDSCVGLGINVALCQIVQWGRTSIISYEYKLQFATELDWTAAMFVI